MQVRDNSPDDIGNDAALQVIVETRQVTTTKDVFEASPLGWRIVIVTGDTKNHEGNAEKLSHPLGPDDASRREEFAKAIVRLESDRRKVGMKTAEMYQIAESRGIDELRAEIDRRLKNLSTDS